MTSRNGSGRQNVPAPVLINNDLAAQLVTAKATGHVDGELAPALLSLLEQLYGSLAAGQTDVATDVLASVIGPALALGQARQTLVTSLIGIDSVLLDYQRRRGPGDAAALPSDVATLIDLSARLRQVMDAAEDTAERIDHYIQLLPHQNT